MSEIPKPVPQPSEADWQNFLDLGGDPSEIEPQAPPPGTDTASALWIWNINLPTPPKPSVDEWFWAWIFSHE